MARKQSRRTVSLSAAKQAAAVRFAENRHVSASALVEYALEQTYASFDEGHFRTWLAARDEEVREAMVARSAQERRIVREDPAAHDRRLRAEEAARWAHDSQASDAAAAVQFDLTEAEVERARRWLRLGQPPRPESLSAQAVVHVEKTGCSHEKAAKIFGITRQAVSQAWARTHPEDTDTDTAGTTRAES